MDITNMRDRFEQLRTPFYYYDTQLLAETLAAIKSETDKHEGLCQPECAPANTAGRFWC
jgi:diaminopimelate decarboxylase